MGKDLDLFEAPRNTLAGTEIHDALGIAALEAEQITQNTAISAAQTKANTNETEIQNARAGKASLLAKNQEQDALISSQGSRLTTAEGNIVTHDSRLDNLEAATPVTNAGAEGVVTAASYAAAGAAVDTATNIVHILGLGTFEATTESVTGATAGNPDDANEHDGTDNLVFEVSTGVFKLFRKPRGRIQVDASQFNINSSNSAAKNRLNLITALAFTSITGAELVFSEAATIEFQVSNPAAPTTLQIAISCPENTHIVIKDESVVQFNNAAGTINHVFLELGSNTSITGRGKIQGLYSSALEGGISANAFAAGANLIKIKRGVKGALVQNVIIKGITLTGSFNYAVVVQRWSQKITIEECVFDENFAHIHLDNDSSQPAGTAIEDIPTIEHIKIKDNHFNYSHVTNPNVSPDHGGTYAGGAYPTGGDGLRTTGGTWFAELSGNHFHTIGRRAFEGYPQNEVNNEAYSRAETQKYGLRYWKIKNNFWHKPAIARTFTVFAQDSDITGNYIRLNLSGVEAGLTNCNISENILVGTQGFDFTKWFPAGELEHLGTKVGWGTHIHNNVFYMGVDAYTPNSGRALLGHLLRDFKFNDNRIHIDKGGTGGAVQMWGCTDFEISGNTVYREDTASGANGCIRIESCRGFKVKENRVIYPYDYNGDTTIGEAPLLEIDGVADCEIENNVLDMRTPLRLNNGGLITAIRIGSNTNDTYFYIDKFAADGATSTRVNLNGLASQPPLSPSINDVYLVTKYPTPTGEFVNQQGNFATYNGSSWDFTTCRGFIWSPLDKPDIFQAYESYQVGELAGLTMPPEIEHNGGVSWVQDGNWYLVGAVFKNVKIKSNQIIHNNHNPAQPSRNYAACQIQNTRVLMFENVYIEGNDFLVNNANPTLLTQYVESIYGGLRIELHQPIPSHQVTSGNFVPGGQLNKWPGTKIRLTPTATGHPIEAISNGTSWDYVGQMGFRTNAGSPISSVTPHFAGEQLFDSTNNKWYRSYGTSNTQWALLGA